jgi:hypothetical protein
MGDGSKHKSKPMKKSRFSLWKMRINGEKRWGINGVRDCGTYTVGPHDGYDTRKDAVAYLMRLRKEERDAAEEIAWYRKHPEAK